MVLISAHPSQLVRMASPGGEKKSLSTTKTHLDTAHHGLGNQTKRPNLKWRADLFPISVI